VAPDPWSSPRVAYASGAIEVNLPRFAVARPVFTTMLTGIVVLLGTVALLRLRVDLLPEIELPRLTVRATYPGASPEVVERSVTQILEEILATVPGVEELTSSSEEEDSRVSMTFAWGTDLDVVAQDVSATLEDELNELPEEVVRPRVDKFDVNSFPIVILGVSSSLDPVELTETIEKEIRYRLARIPGVAQVDTWGAYEREIRVELDPVRVTALRLPLDDVLTAIRDANLDLPTGQIEEGRYEVVLRAPAEFRNLDEIRTTVVAQRDGAPVTLGQIARIRDTHRKLTRRVRIDGDLGLRIAIRKQADANTVEVSKAVLAEIEEINDDVPQVRIVAVSNQGSFIERSIANVAWSVLYGGAFAILVLLLFLRDVRSTLVIALSIPVSAVATFALIWSNGLTLNLMTLGGLALGVGMMVDSSIVVLENVFRRRHGEGESNAEAAERGTSEVASAIVASTITTLVIFLPLVFVRGVSGLLFQELALVIAYSLAAALLVALTIVPLCAARLMRSQGEASTRREAWPFAIARRAQEAVEAVYADLLRACLRRRAATIGASVLLLGSSLLLAPLLGTELLPPSDEGEVSVQIEMEVGTRIDLVDRQTRMVEELVARTVPEATARTVSVRGGSGNEAVGSIDLTLLPAADRARSNSAIAADLRDRLDGAVPGAIVRTRAPQGQRLLDRILGGGGGESLTVEVTGFELETLEVLAAEAARRAAQIPGVTDVDVGRDAGVPQQMLRIDRAKAADLGLSARDVSRALQTAIAGTEAGEYRSGGDAYRILVQMQDAESLSIDEILDLTLRTTDGTDVALRNVVTVEPGRGPIVIERKDQQRIVRVAANVAGRPQGDVARELDAALDGIARPQGYDLRVAGTFEEQQEAFTELSLSLLLAILLVYMALACQYESLVDPLVVMVSVPFAAFGVLVTLFVTDTTLNLQSAIGCIMLGGIVVNNAILLVDQSNRLAAEMGPEAAAFEAGRRRLRPILMTMSTTILGLLPLALGIGEGSEAQAPLARAVVGGLIGSTAITLVLVPVVYALVRGGRARAG
jgi:HAE1 family hydrophobic/amphiphilic exporter-1